MFDFDSFWETANAAQEDRATVQRGWETAYADFQETAVIRYAKGIGPFCIGYNGCMRKLETTLEEVIENPVELRIYQNIRFYEGMLELFSNDPENEETVKSIKIDLEIYHLALKHYLQDA